MFGRFKRLILAILVPTILSLGLASVCYANTPPPPPNWDKTYVSFNVLGAVTLSLTILIEGTIYYLFKYKRKLSWLVFGITNVSTQVFLYIYLYFSRIKAPSYYPNPMSYFFILAFGELLIFVIEAVVFLIFLTERPRWVTFTYVITANITSLVLGGAITLFLPLSRLIE